VTSRARRLAARLAARLRPLRDGGWRSLLVSGALFGSMLVSAAGAWAVRQAWVEHERSVETALDEYARYAARAFVEQVTESQILMRAQASAATMVPADVRPLTLAEYAAAAGAALDRRLGPTPDPGRGYFRYDLRTGQLETLGSAGRVRALRDSLPGLARSHLPEHGGYYATGLSNVRTPLGMLTVNTASQRTRDGTPVAVFGYVQTRRLVARQLAASVPRRSSMLLPPSRVGARWNYSGDDGPDTLVSIRRLDADGTESFRTPRQYASDATGEFVFRGLATSRTIATLHPDLVRELRATYLREERRRLQLVLPLLAIVLAGAGVVHLRRERELQRARRDFVASVSHELRTPLAQIRMFSETLQLRRERDDAERLRWLGVIGREARRLGDLVENILLFSHIDAARVRLEPERTDLGEMVEEVVEAYVPVAAQRQMRLVADAPSRIYALADPRALRQVVVNLLDNALKYGPAGQTVTIEVERGEGPDGAPTATLAVSDEGPGVPRAERARLWEPFVRLGGAGHNAGGSGIGLSVVRSLVEEHHGTVAVDDAPGGGARFVVTIPLGAALPTTAEMRAAARHEVAGRV
jgi:signal transduction histidine kinase